MGEWLARDKVEHFAGSCILVLALMYVIVVKAEIQEPYPALPISILCALAIGAAKEVVYDYYLGLGNPSWRDMIANSAGVSLGALIVLM